MKWYSTRQAREILGVHDNTLRKWDKQGRIKTMRTPGGNRLYDLSEFTVQEEPVLNMVCYCRVPSAKQRDDLASQVAFMREKYPESEVITDVGSGINFKRKGLKALLERSLSGEQLEVVVAYKDRLARFGFELLEWLIERNGGKIVVLNQVSFSPEQELTKDLLTILHVFSCRLYGLRKYKTAIANEQENSEENTSISYSEAESVVC